MMALLLEPLQFTFMSHALLISLVVSIPCALLSVFLVLKGWAPVSYTHLRAHETLHRSRMPSSA